MLPHIFLAMTVRCWEPSTRGSCPHPLTNPNTTRARGPGRAQTHPPTPTYHPTRGRPSTPETRPRHEGAPGRGSAQNADGVRNVCTMRDGGTSFAGSKPGSPRHKGKGPSVHSRYTHAHKQAPRLQLSVGTRGLPVAVALGFEPRVAVTPHSISSAAPSAARTRYLTRPY